MTTTATRTPTVADDDIGTAREVDDTPRQSFRPLRLAIALSVPTAFLVAFIVAVLAGSGWSLSRLAENAAMASLFVLTVGLAIATVVLFLVAWAGTLRSGELPDATAGSWQPFDIDPDPKTAAGGA